MKSELLVLESIQSQQRHALKVVPAAAAHPVLIFWRLVHVAGLVDESLAEVVEIV
jgi:kynureninase